MANPNYQLLIDAAKLLKPMLGELVFIGGCSTGLLITDKAAANVRPTLDVDAIAEITSYVGYIQLSERLKKLGFREDTREGAPRCRWRQNTTTLDVMPVDGTLFGFRNAWYGPAVKTAEIRELEPGLEILVVNSVYFCASKLEAFGDRGRSDYLGSRDLEDVVAVVDGRPELLAESEELRPTCVPTLLMSSENCMTRGSFRMRCPGIYHRMLPAKSESGRSSPGLRRSSPWKRDKVASAKGRGNDG